MKKKIKVEVNTYNVYTWRWFSSGWLGCRSAINKLFPGIRTGDCLIISSYPRPNTIQFLLDAHFISPMDSWDYRGVNVKWGDWIDRKLAKLAKKYETLYIEHVPK